MNKKTVFEKEISYIKKEKYRENAFKIIELLPDYFFEEPASSTGKYHPAFSQGIGGLVRHTKAAVRIAYELLNNETIGGSFKPEEKDLMILGLLIHDGLKSGLVKSQYTLNNHPTLVCNYLKENKDKLTLTDNEINFICSSIESHMGQWNTDFNGNEILPKPLNKYQRFIHMCDYLSSKKFLNINFENDIIVD